MIGLQQPLRELSLHYIETLEYKIDSELTRELLTGGHHLFGFVMKGSVKVALESDGMRRASKVSYGEVFLLPPGCLCSFQNSDKKPSHLILIRFECDERGSSCRSHSPFVMRDKIKLHHFRMPRVGNWVQDLLSESTQSDPSLYYSAHSHLYAIASKFMALVTKSASTEDSLLDYVLQIKQSMLDHYRVPVDIEEIARLSGASSARFYQEFKQYTGLSPLKYMTMVRLNESLRLLASSPSSIMDVAHAVGYPDELYFSRLFKKHMGISPTEYAHYAKVRVANLCPVFSGDLSVLGISPVLELLREWYSDPDKDKYMKQVERSKPELIFTAPVPDEIYDTLSQICPVVMIHWKGYPWKERLLEISRVLNIPTVAERWLLYFQMKVENARQHIQRELGGEPFLVVSALEPFFRVYGMQRIKMKDLFYDELRLTPPEAAHDISFLDVKTLAEVAVLDCNNVLFLAPASLSDESLLGLEEDWLRLKRNRQKKHCIFIRHEEPLLYNASFYESLIDQFVDYLLLYRS